MGGKRNSVIEQRIWFSDSVKRRELHLESEEKFLEKCGIVGGVAWKVRSSRSSCFKSEEC